MIGKADLRRDVFLGTLISSAGFVLDLLAGHLNCEI